MIGTLVQCKLAQQGMYLTEIMDCHVQDVQGSRRILIRSRGYLLSPMLEMV